MMADLAQVLVTTALVVGPDRAIAAATDVIGKDTFADVLPFVQPAVLDRDTRRAVRDGDWDLDDLMARSTELTGTEAPELEQIRRVTGKSIAIVALIAFVAYGLISTLAHVGLEALWDELKSANLAWMLTALILAPISQVPQAFSTLGASLRDMVFVPVLMLQYAIQFIQLAVPSSAARVALEVRFFQRNGVETGAALSIGLIDSLSRFVIQVAPDPDHHALGVGEPRSLVRQLRLVEQLVLLVGTEPACSSRRRSSSSEGSSRSRSRATGPGSREAIPRYRAAIRAQMSEGAKALRVLHSPSKVTMLFLGNFVAQMMLAMILGICLRAFGESTSFAGLVLVNTMVALFAGFMPVPGGMGVSEAALTAGLVALGVPNAVAMSTAIAYRLVTFYLPPIWGSLATRWLKQHQYL